MHWLDTVILAVLAFGALAGAFTGFLWQLSRIVTLILAIYCTVIFHDSATPLVKRLLLPDAPELIPSLTAYGLVFVLVCAVMFTVTFVLHKVIEQVELQWFNRLLGALFGVAKAALVLGVVLFGLSGYDSSNAVISQSKVAKPMVESVRWGATLLPESYRKQIEAYKEQADRAAKESQLLKAGGL